MTGIHRLVAVVAAAAGLAIAAGAPAGAQAPRPAAAAVPLELLKVQGNVYMLAGAGPNVTLQIGPDAVLLVNAPSAARVQEALAEIRKISDKPIRRIVQTSSDAENIDGTPALIGPAAARGTGGAPFGTTGANRPAIVAHENVLNRLSTPSAGLPATPAAALPTMTYFTPTWDFLSNGEPVIVEHLPAAHTDGDSLVLFRSSDVVATGDIYAAGRYPVIDSARGGSVRGLIAALNRVLAITVPDAFQENGTQVVPAYGRISDESDVVEYRDMVVIIRDRIQDMVQKGMTLEQTTAARPSRDYDLEYGNAPGSADRFVESVYRSLVEGRER